MPKDAWQKLTGRVRFLILGAACLVGSIHFTRTAVLAVRSARAIKTWPRAQGRVVAHSEIETHRNRYLLGTAHVRYEYAVDGRTHRGQLRYERRRIAHVEDLLARYPVGKAITLHYDPADPARSVLEQSPSSATYGYLAIGILMGVGAFVLFYVLIARSPSGAIQAQPSPEPAHDDL